MVRIYYHLSDALCLQIPSINCYKNQSFSIARHSQYDFQLCTHPYYPPFLVNDWVYWKCFFDGKDDLTKTALTLSVRKQDSESDNDVDDVDDDDDINDGKEKKGGWDQISFYPRTFLCRGSQYTTA